MRVRARRAIASVFVCLAVVLANAADARDFRPPIVTSVAPDQESCTTASADLQINGLCFFGEISQVFLSSNPDGTGARFDLKGVSNPNEGTANAVVEPGLLAPNTPYYVFVVRVDGARSTSF